MDFVPVIEKQDTDVRVPNVASDGRMGHLLETPRYCWCDTKTIASLEAGIVEPFYVVEVKVAAWEDQDPRNDGLLKVNKVSLRNHNFNWLLQR